MSERSSIRGSTRLSGAYVRLAALGIAMAVASLAVPAQADFYSLAGRFECLDKPAGSCGGPGRAELLPPPAQRLSQAGNAHATELLAWCDYKGIGAAPDPVAAYVLYGIAALGGVPTARQNQAVIYEYALTSEQRQKVLDMQNEVLANP